MQLGEPDSRSGRPSSFCFRLSTLRERHCPFLRLLNSRDSECPDGVSSMNDRQAEELLALEVRGRRHSTCRSLTS